VIAIVDYGFGNLDGMAKAFRQVGAAAVLTGDPDALGAARALVLPGDGPFDAAMDELRARGLLPVLYEAAAAGTPILGIGVGMQLLFEQSEEHGRNSGLGLLCGRVRRLGGELSVPHLGWKRLHQQRRDALLEGVPGGAQVYFAHSYYCEARAEDVIASSSYGASFAAMVGSRNVFGLQFQPEQSQGVGLRVLANFAAAVRVRRSARLEARSYR
jgi:glutamine amidotransferase